MKKFECCFYHSSPPQAASLETDAPSAKRANEWAKNIAKERGWRLIEVRLLTQRAVDGAMPCAICERRDGWHIQALHDLRETPRN